MTFLCRFCIIACLFSEGVLRPGVKAVWREPWCGNPHFRVWFFLFLHLLSSTDQILMATTVLLIKKKMQLHHLEGHSCVFTVL